MFRTYHASVTLDRLLWEDEEEDAGGSLDHKKALYDRANKEVWDSGYSTRSFILSHKDRTVVLTAHAGVLHPQGECGPHWKEGNRYYWTPTILSSIQTRTGDCAGAILRDGL